MAQMQSQLDSKGGTYYFSFLFSFKFLITVLIVLCFEVEEVNSAIWLFDPGFKR